MYRSFIAIMLAFIFGVTAFAEVSVSGLTAKQRYPWNGLVDIECDIAYEDADALLEVSIVATNLATMTELPVRTIHVANGDGMAVKAGHCAFVWDADADITDKVKFDKVSLVVDSSVFLDGVQLWAGGPYWAECNVGATKPEEYGYYFWWGDTVGYKREGNSWNAVDGSKTGFSFSSDNCPTYGKGNSQLQSLGYIDESGNLVAAHDAATAHLGAPWRMPTDSEWSALISNCDTEWTTRNGVNGRLVKGRGAYSSKSIFLPAAGDGDGSGLCGLGSYGNDWSSSPRSDYSIVAWYLYFSSGNFGRSNYDRYNGQSVRPLRVFAPTVPNAAFCGVSTHFSLDTRTVREPAASETITYNHAWGNGDSVTITLDGETIGTFTEAGETTIDTTGWSGGVHTLTHTSGDETLTASFDKPYSAPEISGLTARQRYPWNGLVDIECDIGYEDPNADLWVSIVATNTATGAALPVKTVHVADGDGMAVKAGHCSFVWDAGADVPNVDYTSVALTVSASLCEHGLSVRYYDVGSSNPYSTWCSSCSGFMSYFDSRTPALEGNSSYFGDTMEATHRNSGDFNGGILHGKYGDGSTEYFATYLTGRFMSETTGNYQFEVWGDDYVVLYIDGILVCRSVWDDTGVGTIVLSKGMHEIAMASYEVTGGHGFRLRLKRPMDTSWAVAPMSLFGTSGGFYEYTGATTQISLDTRTVREPAASETITYNPAWGDGDAVTIALDGETIGTFTEAGETTIDTTGWSGGEHTLTHTSGGETLTASFNIPYAPPEISNLTARQRYPWNGLVDIEFAIEGAAGTKYDTSFVAKDVKGGTNITMKTLTKSDGTAANPLSEQLLPGTYNWVWDATTDLGEGTVLDKVVADVNVEDANEVLDINNATYMVIDLSGGSSAMSYPVSFLDDVPSGGWSYTYKTSKLVLRRCEPGTFTMDGYGASASHKVILTNPFYIGVFEVTQNQYQLVTGANPSYHVGDMFPVESMTWLDIRNGSESFIARLQRRCGYDSLDLPTEAQWEYAGKGGGKLGGVAAARATSEVGSTAANGWGIYDMQGNVDEWMLDGWVQYGTETCTDPTGSDRSVRVIKGGYYGQTGSDPCNVIGYRTNENQACRHQYTGFRVCVTVQ